MENINDIISCINGILWGWPMIVLLLGTHIYLTIILKFPQRKIFKAIKQQRNVKIIDWRYRILVFFWRLIPRWLWVRLPIKN